MLSAYLTELFIKSYVGCLVHCAGSETQTEWPSSVIQVQEHYNLAVSPGEGPDPMFIAESGVLQVLSYKWG